MQYPPSILILLSRLSPFLQISFKIPPPPRSSSPVILFWSGLYFESVDIFLKLYQNCKIANFYFICKESYERVNLVIMFLFFEANRDNLPNSIGFLIHSVQIYKLFKK